MRATMAWAPIDVSPDGKYLYQFGEKITILQASDFKVIDHIESVPAGRCLAWRIVHFGSDLGSG